MEIRPALSPLINGTWIKPMRGAGKKRIQQRGSGLRRSFHLEQLEDRRLLSVTLSWQAVDGTLTLEGSSAGDTIHLSATQGEIPLVVLNGSSDLLIAGSISQIPAEAVQQLTVHGNAGADRIDLTEITAFNFPGLVNPTEVYTIRVDGGPGRDALLGSSLPDSLDGGQGNDWIDGGFGDDLIKGGLGRDQLSGGSGNDTLDVGELGGHPMVDPHDVTSDPLTEGIARGSPQSSLVSFQYPARQIPGRPEVTALVVEQSPEDQVLRRVSATFSSDVSALLSASSLRLKNLSSSQTYHPLNSRWDVSSQTAYWELPHGVRANSAADAFLIELDGPSLITTSGHALSGDYFMSGTHFRQEFNIGEMELPPQGMTTSRNEFESAIRRIGNASFAGDLWDHDSDRLITPRDILIAWNSQDSIAGRTFIQLEIVRGDFGDDRYLVADPAGRSTVRIEDSSGHDTLDLSRIGRGTLDTGIDLDAMSVLIPGPASTSRTMIEIGLASSLLNVMGTPFDDRISGTSDSNRLVGAGGNDVLDGKSGEDILLGEAGSDELLGGVGNDQLDGGSGDDTYYFHENPGFDSLVDGDGFHDRLDFSGAAQGVRVDLGQSIIAEAIDRNSYRLFAPNNPIEDVTGSAWDDILRGDDRPNRIQGNAGNDIIMSLGDADQVYGGSGVDAIDPGVGLDFMDGGSEFDEPEIQDTPTIVTSGFEQQSNVDAFNQTVFVAIEGSGAPSETDRFVRWTFSNVPAGSFEILATWPAWPQGSREATFRLPQGQTVVVDQSLAPHDARMSDTSWQSLGLVTSNAGEVSIELHADNSHGDVLADAIRLVPVGGLPQIRDIPPIVESETTDVVVELQADYALGNLLDLEWSLGEDAPEDAYLVTDEQSPSMATLHWPHTIARGHGTFQIPVRIVDRTHVTRQSETLLSIRLGEANQAPQFLSVQYLDAYVGDRVIQAFRANDPDGPEHELRFELGPDHPASAFLHPVTGRLGWETAAAVPGTYEFQVIVTDRGNPPLSTAMDWIVHLHPRTPMPEIQLPSDQSVVEDGSLTFSSILGRGISVSGLLNQPVTLGIVAEHGRIRMGSTSGLTFETGTTELQQQIKVRGLPASINAALEGLQFVPDADYRGETAIRFELDRWSRSTASGEPLLIRELPLQIIPSLEAPQLFDQRFHFEPSIGATGLFRIGKITAIDRDPDQWLRYRITGGNSDQAFQIDDVTGELTTHDPHVVDVADRTITVEAFYLQLPQEVAFASVTIHRVPLFNSPPEVSADAYQLLESGTVTGNFIAGDLIGGWQDSDPDGDSMTLTSVSDMFGDSLPMGVPMTLRSGAIITITPNGAFSLDASASLALDSGLHGTTSEELRYVLMDAHGATTEGTILLQYDHENDPPQVIDQNFVIAPQSDEHSLVGRVMVANIERDEPLQYAIVAGNESGYFSITSDGELWLETTAETLPAHPMSLTLEVRGDDGSPQTATLTLTKDSHLPPTAFQRVYRTGSDLPLFGNVLVDTYELISATDPDGGLLEVVEVAGAAAYVGRSIDLPGGSHLLVRSDGSLEFDPRTNRDYQRLAHGEHRTEQVTLTIRDNDGSMVAALLELIVEGRNRTPIAQENRYILTSSETITGNFISDMGPGQRLDADPNGDSLRVVSANQQMVTETTSFATFLGAQFTLSSDGSFHYDPRSVELSAFLPGSRLVDELYYAIADPLGRTSRAIVRFLVTKSDDDFHPFQIENFRLVSDTFEHGGDSSDHQTEDPRIAGMVSGLPAGMTRFQIELDLDAADETGLQETTALINDHSLTILTTDSSFPHFELDPRTVASFGDFGSKAIAYRAKALDANLVAVATTSWRYFVFQWIQGDVSGPLRIDPIDLFHDTGTFDASGVPIGQNDRITGDPRILGAVRGNFNDPPLAPGASRFVRLEFTHESKGNVYEGQLLVTSPEAFLYDPRSIDTSLREAYDSPLTVHYSAYRVDQVGEDFTEAWIQDGSTTFHYFTPPVACPTVTLEEEEHPTPVYVGTVRVIAGSVLFSGNCSSQSEQILVEFDYEISGGDFDGAPDASESLFGVPASATQTLDFEHVAVQLVGVSPRIRARVRQWSAEFQDFQIGDWSPPLELARLVGPPIAAMNSHLQMVNSRQRIFVVGYLLGGAEDPSVPVNSDLGHVGSVSLEFFHRSENEQVFSDAWLPDGTGITNPLGSFEYLPLGISYDTDYRIWARTVVQLSDGSRAYGNPFGIDDVRLSRPELPTLADFRLFDPSSAEYANGRWQTEDTRARGMLADGPAGAIPMESVRIEFAHDYLHVVGDEQTVVGAELPTIDGNFRYEPILAAGNVTLRARVYYFDPLLGAPLYGIWQFPELELQVQPGVNDPATVERLVLTSPDKTATVPPRTRRAELEGTIANRDGYRSFVPVELREVTTGVILGQTVTDANGEFSLVLEGLTPQTYRVGARTYDWNYDTTTWHPGPWSENAEALEFIIETPIAKDVTTWELLSDTGPVPGVTANPALLGQVSGPALELTGTLVAIDWGNDGSVDEMVSTDGQGWFSLFPEALVPGVHVYGARVATWDAAHSRFNYSPGMTTSFLLESQPNRAAAITSVRLANPPTTGVIVSDATLVGRIANERQLDGITIELDLDSSDTNGIDTIATTDRLGQFAIVPNRIEAGLVAPRIRTREWDPQNAQDLIGHWYTLPAFQYEPSLPVLPAMTIEVLGASGSSAPVTDSGRIGGQVQYGGDLSSAIVEFSRTQAGPILGVAAIALDGTFSYTIPGLSEGQNEIWARARVPDGSSPDGYRYSAYMSLRFAYQPLSLSDIRISEFRLFNDTAELDGTTSSDGSTSDSHIMGRVSWTGGGVTGRLIEIDGNEDFQPDYSVGSASDGTFDLAIPIAMAGFHTLKSRVTDGSGYPSNWRTLNFVFDENPSSERALRFVQTLATMNPNWQQAEDLDSKAVRRVERILFHGLQDLDLNADESADEAQGQAVRDAIGESVDRAYEAGRTSAESNYQQAIEQARLQFLAELANLPVAQRATYSVQPFKWPESPVANQLQIPSALVQSQPPSVPIYGPSDFDFQFDLSYRSASFAAQQAYMAALVAAEQEHLSDQVAETQRHANARNAILAAYAARASTELAEYEEAQANKPEIDSAAVQDILDAIDASWLTYNRRHQAIYNRYNLAITDAERTRNAASVSLHADHAAAILGLVEWYQSGDWPNNATPARHNQFASENYRLERELDAQIRPLEAEYSRVLAAETQTRNKAIAEAFAEASAQVWELKTALTVLGYQFQHDVDVDTWNDRFSFRSFTADRTRDQEKDLAVEVATHDRNIADLRYTRERKLAEAIAARDLSIAVAAEMAVANWSAIVDNPWADLRSELATIDRVYQQSIGQLQWQRTLGRANAARIQAQSLSSAKQAHLTAIADAEYDRDIALATRLVNLDVNSSEIALQRRIATTNDRNELEQSVAEAVESGTKRTADLVLDRDIGRIDATEANFQPRDLYHARCIPDEECVGAGAIWEFYVATDNSSVRDRNADRYTRMAAKADLDYQLGSADSQQLNTEAFLAAIEPFRLNVNSRYRDAEVALASLYAGYQIEVAEAQDQYHFAITSAAAELATSRVMAESDSAKRTLLAEKGYDVGRVRAMRDFNVASTQADRDQKVELAGIHRAQIDVWGETQPEPWAEYQRALADAEVARATQLRDTDVAAAIRDGSTSVRRASDEYSVHLTFADAVYGSQGAFVRRAEAVSLAYVTIAQSMDFSDFVTPQANALRMHDEAVTNATLAYRHSVVLAEGTRDRAIENAIAIRERAFAQTEYAYAIDPTVDREQLKTQARVEYARAAADANEALVLLRESRRRDWKHAISDSNLIQAEGIITARLARAETTHGNALVHAAAIHQGMVYFSQILATATAARQLGIARAEGNESVLMAHSQSLHAVESVDLENTYRSETMLARQRFETTLYTDHAASIQAWLQLGVSPFATYQASIANADREAAVARQQAEELRQAALSLANRNQQLTTNLAEREHTSQTASAKLQFATAITSLESSLHATLGTAVAFVESRTADVKAVRSNHNAESLAAADRAAASAAVRKDKALTDAEFHYVEVLAASRADLEVACAIDLFTTGGECEEAQDSYLQKATAAEQTRQTAIDAALSEYRQAIRDLQLLDDEGVNSALEEYVQGIESAKAGFVNGQAIANTTYATLAAAAQADHARNGSAADRILERTKSQAYLAFTIASADAALDKQQAMRDAAVQWSSAHALADTAYWKDVSLARSQEWQALAAMNPNDDYLRFKSAESSSEAQWIADVAPWLVQSYSGRTFALEQARFEELQTNQKFEIAMAEARQAHELANQELVSSRRIATSTLQQAESTAVLQSNGQLASRVSQLNKRYAEEIAQAESFSRTRNRQIQQQFEIDHDDGARTDALRLAQLQRSTQEALAVSRWRKSIADAESEANLRLKDGKESLARQLVALERESVDSKIANDQLLELLRAQAHAVRHVDRAEVVAHERNRQALAQTELVTAGRSAQVTAMAEFDERLSTLWSNFEWQLATKESQAWQNARSDYLAWQTNVGQAEVSFAINQAESYLNAATSIAMRDTHASEQRADVVRNAHLDLVIRQSQFDLSLDHVTHRYRDDLADAERTFHLQTASAVANSTDPGPILSAYESAQIELAVNYESQYALLNRSRRIDLAGTGSQLNALSQAIRLQQVAEQHAAQVSLDQELMDAYFLESTEDALQYTLGQLEAEYVTAEEAARIEAYDEFSSSPWSNLAKAELQARHDNVTIELSDLNHAQRETLARARRDYHWTSGIGARSEVRSAEFAEALLQHATTVDVINDIPSQPDAAISAPETTVIPEVDLGSPLGSRRYFHEYYPGVQDIETFGESGHSDYWGGNYWGVGNYLGQELIWTGFYWGNFGWSPLNNSGTGSYLEPYYGIWGYAPWAFSWNGWAPNYSAPPAGVSRSFEIHPEAQLSGVATRIQELLNLQNAQVTTLELNKDPYRPSFDSLAGKLLFGDLQATLDAVQLPSGSASHALRKFTDSSNAGRLDQRVRDLIPLSQDLLQPRVNVQASATIPTSELQPYDFGARFYLERNGNDIFLTQGHFEEPSQGNFLDNILSPSFEKDQGARIGILGQHDWVHLSQTFGGGRATLSALQNAVDAWNSQDMERILRIAESTGISLNREDTQFQQLIDGVRSPSSIDPSSETLGIFIGGTDMHMYGIGNVEKMYNMFRGTKFYYGGVGNRIDSNHPTIEGAVAVSEFESIIDRAEADVLKYGPGRTIYIFGWSRGAAQSAELARRLEVRNIPVEFVGMFDPVYSVYLPGQQSKYVEHSAEGFVGNFVERKLAANIKRAVAIYAMNEVRSWFPATIMTAEEGSDTEVYRLSSPGAHGEIGGHWASNIYVQQLNLHQMIAYVPANDLVFDQDKDAKDSHVQKIYDSVYTLYVGVREEGDASEAIEVVSVYLSAIDQTLWMNVTSLEYASMANSKSEDRWTPGPLSAQTGNAISSLSETNAAFVIESAIAVLAPFGIVIGFSTLPLIGAQPLLDHYARDVSEMIDRSMTDLYSGIDGSFVDVLMQRRINPFDGGWFN